MNEDAQQAPEFNDANQTTPASPVDAAVQMISSIRFSAFEEGRQAGRQELIGELRQMLDRLSMNTPTEDVPSLGIREIGLTRRVSNALHREGIQTVGQASKTTDADLHAIRSFGRNSINELDAALARYGVVRRKH